MRLGFELRGFALAKQALYCLSHISSLFCSGSFRDGVSWTICLGWPCTPKPSYSVSQVARITVMNHQHLAMSSVLNAIWDVPKDLWLQIKPSSQDNFFFNLFIYFFVHLFTCAYIVWVISPPCPPPPLFPLPPSVSGRSRSALISDFVEEKTCIIRKTKHFC
jgi:hypothetical protein